MSLKNVAKAFDRFLPSKEEPILVKEVSSKKVTARMEITEHDVCPVCKTVMSKADAAGHAVYVCHKDRVVFPQPD